MSVLLILWVLKQLPDRTNRGFDANSKKAKKRAQEIASEQLQNRYWLVFFEDNSVQTIPSLHKYIALDTLDRLAIKMSIFFLRSFSEALELRLNSSYSCKT